MAIQVYQSFSAYYHRAAAIILLVGLLIRLFIAICLNPGFDEAYYYLYTLHPDWSYFDCPPLVGLTTNIGIWLTGEVSQLTIRIGTLLLYTGSLIFLYLTALRLYTLQIAINTLAIASAIPIFQLAFGVFASPNAPLLFFSSISLWLAAREFFYYRGYQPSFRLTLIFLTIGLACLGSYYGFFLGFGVIGFCLFSSNYRHGLISKWFWLGIVIFTAVILPLLYWQVVHGWPDFNLDIARIRSIDRYRIDLIFSTVLMEMFYLFPSFGVPLVWSIVRAFFQQFKSFKVQHYTSFGASKTQWDMEKRGLILWIALPLIIGLTLVSGDRQILPDDKMSGFWMATILLAERISIVRRNSQERIPYQWFFGSIGVITLLLSIGLTHVTIGTFQAGAKPSILGVFPIQLDPSTQIFDIQQLRQGLISNSKLKSALQRADFVFTNRYYLGGQIGMAIEPTFHKQLTCFDANPHNFAFWSKPRQWVGKNAIYLGTKTFDVDLDAKVRYPSYFQKIAKLGEIPIRRGGEIVQTFSVYQAQNMLKSFPFPYGN